MRNLVLLVLTLVVIITLLIVGTNSYAGCVFDGDMCLSGSQFANDHFLMPAAQMAKETPGTNPPQCTFKDDPVQTIFQSGPAGTTMHGERRKYWRSDTGNITFKDIAEPTSSVCALKTLRERWGMRTYTTQDKLTYLWDIKTRGDDCSINPPKRYSFHGCHTNLIIAWNGCDACPEAFAALGNCSCVYTTPIILSLVPGQRFDIEDVDAGEGRPFDVNADGKKSRMAFPKDVANVGFLYIKAPEFATDLETGIREPVPQLSGQNLFGNADGHENGFKKLARYDDPQLSASLDQVVGPPNGVINAQDGIWKQLWVWFDLNRNGEAEVSELKTLDELNIEFLEVAYTTSKRQDGHGDEFIATGRFKKKGDPQWYFMVDYIAAVKAIP